jgi:hypothetical protein
MPDALRSADIAWGSKQKSEEWIADLQDIDEKVEKGMKGKPAEEIEAERARLKEKYTSDQWDIFVGEHPEVLVVPKGMFEEGGIYAEEEDVFNKYSPTEAFKRFGGHWGGSTWGPEWLRFDDWLKDLPEVDGRTFDVYKLEDRVRYANRHLKARYDDGVESGDIPEGVSYEDFEETFNELAKAGYYRASQSSTAERAAAYAKDLKTGYAGAHYRQQSKRGGAYSKDQEGNAFQDLLAIDEYEKQLRPKFDSPSSWQRYLDTLELYNQKQADGEFKTKQDIDEFVLGRSNLGVGDEPPRFLDQESYMEDVKEFIDQTYDAKKVEQEEETASLFDPRKAYELGKHAVSAISHIPGVGEEGALSPEEIENRSAKGLRKSGLGESVVREDLLRKVVQEALKRKFGE